MTVLVSGNAAITAGLPLFTDLTAAVLCKQHRELAYTVNARENPDGFTLGICFLKGLGRIR
jgi:hypothetical protein